MAGCLCLGQRKSKKNSENQSNEQSRATPSVPNFNLDTNRQNTDAESEQMSPAPRQNTDAESEQRSPAPADDGNEKVRVFNYQELAIATRNFHADTLVGGGGFGPVYKGELRTGELVAVKRLNQSGLQGEKEFLMEVLMLSHLHHPNLVNMIGYCAEGSQRLLVLEFMPYGSLERHIHDIPSKKEPLDWNSRMKIAAGIARGVNYLHNEAKAPVIFRDLKPSNILLDKGYHPKLCDFGFAKIGPVGGSSHVTTRVIGTYGYCAPEYANTGKLTPKSDTYSFGVVLLEIVSGHKAMDPRHEQPSLVEWARKLFKDRNNYLQFADPNLKGEFPKSDLLKVVDIAEMCLRDNANARPTMKDVVEAMDYLTSQRRHAQHRALETEFNPRRSSKSPPGKSPLGPGKSPLGPRISPLSPSKSTLSPGDPPMSPGKSPLSPENLPLSPGKSPKILSHDGDKEQAVSEVEMWVENWQEKRQQGAGSSSADS